MEPCRAKARPLRPRRSYFAPAGNSDQEPVHPEDGCVDQLLITAPWWRRRVLPPGPIGLLRRPFIAIAGLRRQPALRQSPPTGDAATLRPAIGLRESHVVLWACILRLRICQGSAARVDRSRWERNLPRLLPLAHRNVLRITLCEPNGRFGAHGAGCHGGNMSEGVSPSPGGTRPGFSINTHNLIGGLIVTVLALFMLGYAFYVPNTVIPRLMLAALAVIGIAAPGSAVSPLGPARRRGCSRSFLQPSAPPSRSAASLPKGRRSKSTKYAARLSSLSLFSALPP